MRHRLFLHNSFLCVALTALVACGGGGSNGAGATSAIVSAPSAPQDAAVFAGDRMLSVGWSAPLNSGGATIQSYDVVVAPPVAASDVIVSGTRAVVRNLSNGQSYSVSVSARNSAGAGPGAMTSALTPRAANTANYAALVVNGDDSMSGIFDPSILRASNGDVWMSYSSVHYYNNASSQLVQDVGIRLARSTDGGATFTYIRTIASPGVGAVTDTDPNRSACGTATCTGRWVYETSWLIDDAADPNAARRFKLFAHRYFLQPSSSARTLYHLGAIVMWTAATLDGAWSVETPVLAWNLTPPELLPARATINGLHGDLAPCLVLAEGGAMVRGASIDFVFSCPYTGGAPLPQKIVMLRSADHAASFQYIATLLQPSDATLFGATFFTAPALVEGAASLLLVTPTVNGIYAGCIAIPFADATAGSLFRIGAAPVNLLQTPALPGHFGGACAYHPALGSRGILQNDAIPAQPATNTQFRIVATRATLQ